MVKEKFHKKRNGCEIEGYMDMTNEDKPKFKVKIKGKNCQKLLKDLK